MSVNRVLSDGSTQLLAGATLWADMPIGTVIGSFSESAPAGFLYCDDTAYSASSYPELWAILPSTVKDTVNNTFTIDLRESSLKGIGLTSKSNNHYDSDGVALGEFVEDRLQDHTHYPYKDIEPNVGQYFNGGLSTGLQDFPARTGSVQNNYYVGHIYDGNKGATTEVKSTGVRWYIKAKQVALPADLESAVEDAVEEAVTYGNGVINTSASSNILGGSALFAKFGKMVTVTGYIQLSADTSSFTDAIVTGLPTIASSHIAPVFFENSTNDIVITGYTRFEHSSLYANNLKAGFNRFSFSYISN